MKKWRAKNEALFSNQQRNRGRSFNQAPYQVIKEIAGVG